MKKLLITTVLFASCSPRAQDNSKVNYAVGIQYLDKAVKDSVDAAIQIDMMQASSLINEMQQDSFKAALNGKYRSTYMHLKQAHPKALLSDKIIQLVDTGGVN